MTAGVVRRESIPVTRTKNGCLSLGDQASFSFSGRDPVLDVCCANRLLFRLRRMLHPHQKKSYHFDTTFFIQTAGLAYHHASACISSALWVVYHHSSECIFLRFDEILARKRDILVFGRMIFSHFVSDDIHFLRK